MNFGVTVRSGVRQFFGIVTPIFLGLFPLHWLWKRKKTKRSRSSAIGKQELERHESSLYSQNGEDGIIQYLFSQIGVSSKLFLEFGFGVVENNSLRLILKENWGGVLIDGSAASVHSFNRALREKNITKVKSVQKFLTLENLKLTILENGLTGQIDLLSIDVDGNDYWFWNDITYLTPRVVVIEYNATFGAEASITVPYDPLFERYAKHPSGFYHGASLAALTRLASRKGYALVGCDSSGVNAFFVRRDCLSMSVQELQPINAYRSNKRRIRNGISIEMQFNLIKDMPYITIE